MNRPFVLGIAILACLAIGGAPIMIPLSADPANATQTTVQKKKEKGRDQFQSAEAQEEGLLRLSRGTEPGGNVQLLRLYV